MQTSDRDTAAHENAASECPASIPEPHLELIEAACRQLHAAASSASAAAGLAKGIMVLASFPDTKNAPFEIGDWEGMTAKACEWAAQENRNVYFALAIYRGGVVSDRSRGAERDILAVFGVGADLDRDKDNRLEIDHLPIRPSIDVLSSGADSAHAANHNLILLFDRAIPASEARELASAFGTLVGDEAPNRGDPGVGAVERTHGWIGQLFTDVGERGWSTARTPWGLGRIRNPKPLSPEAIAVQAAGREMVATGQAIDRLRSAWFSQVVASHTGCADVMSVAYVISRHFSSDKGFAWPSYERVAAMLGWSQESPASGYERVRKAVARLAHDQYLVTTDGRGRGAHGRPGGSYAPRFQDATWAEMMAHDAAVFEARTGTDVRPMLLPPPGPQRVPVTARVEVVDTPTQETTPDQAPVDTPTHETTASRSKDRVRRSKKEEVASKSQEQGPNAPAGQPRASTLVLRRKPRARLGRARRFCTGQTRPICRFQAPIVCSRR